MDNNYSISKDKIDYINDLKEYSLVYCFDEELRKAEQRIIAKNDPDLSYLFAITFNEANVNEHADIVIASNDVTRIDDFVCDVANIDLKHFEDKLIELGNMQALLNFARHFQGKFDVSRISNIIIASGDAKYNYLLAKDVSGVDIHSHGQVVIDSGNPKFCYTFARDIDVHNIKNYERVVLASENPEWCYAFFKDVPNASKKLLRQVIIKSENPEYNYLMALIDEESKDVYKEIVMNSNNEEVIAKWNNSFGTEGLKLIKK